MPLANFDELMNLARYKGMVETEAYIMRQWIIRHAAEFDRIEFEVRLGPGGDAPAEWSDQQRAEYKHLTQRRADAIAWLGDNAVIIEVKTRLKPQDVGQLLTYRWLFLNDFPHLPQPRMLAIGRRGGTDVTTSLNVHGIDVELFPES